MGGESGGEERIDRVCASGCVGCVRAHGHVKRTLGIAHFIRRTPHVHDRDGIVFLSNCVQLAVLDLNYHAHTHTHTHARTGQQTFKINEIILVRKNMNRCNAKEGNHCKHVKWGT